MVVDELAVNNFLHAKPGSCKYPKPIPRPGDKPLAGDARGSLLPIDEVKRRVAKALGRA